MRALGPPLSDDERLAYIAAARSLARAETRFRHQGRGEFGVDCAGLVIYGLRAAGREPVDADGYGRIPYKDRLEGLLSHNFGPCVSDMREGDVVLLRMAADPHHVGIVTRHPLGGYAILHSFAQVRKVVEHRMDDLWLSYVYKVFRP